MADYTNPLDSKSYINKDYNTIWVEILDLVKKISYRWDPSISNESDPGVVLAKLDAIIADKNNYNIDKNILETAPSSVAQLPDARALFDQLGYTMHWYVGGTTQLSLKFVQQTSEDSAEQELPPQVTLPRFSMVCNDDNSVVFTTTEEVILPTNGTVRTVPVIQGSKVDYTINDQELITIDYLDNENRLYFNDTNVAENGIFIKNDKQENTNSWNRVDNLTVEQLGQKVYKFGVLANSNTPYIEFPSDASDLFGDGIYITYVKTDGENGNINAKIIDRFYAYVNSPEGVTLDNDNVSMANFSAVLNGRNPESINDAYRNYKKVTGTFNTLVTLRDYINAIYNTELVSNDFVVDRTNDLQSSYYIITNQNDVNTTKLMNGYAGSDDGLNAFNLKMCILNWIDSPTTRELFDKSFEAVDNIRTNNDGFLIDQTQQNILDILDDLKSIQHDFASPIADVPLFFKNRFPIECKIIPNYRLTDLQQKEVQGNIILALYNALYSRKIDFGEEVDYDKIYDIIVNADERINYVVLDDIKYGTFAVYYDDNDYKFKEILISDTEVIQANIQNNVATEWSTQTVITPDVTKLYQNSQVPDTATIYQYIGGRFTEVPGTVTLYNGVPSTDIRENFRNDIFAKSVLAGKTQLLVPDNAFRRDIGQQIEKEFSAKSVSTDLQIHFKNLNNGEKQYTLKDNENIIFFKPSLIDKVNYSAYVKYELYTTPDGDVNPDGMAYGGYTTTQTFVYNGQNQKIVLERYASPLFENADNWWIVASITNGSDNFTQALKNNNYLQLDPDSNSITIRTNPILTRNQSYTLYYPYVGYNTIINSNSIYKLGTNDKLTFYWKDNDDSASYSYQSYGKDTVISPNFTLTPTNTQFQMQLSTDSGIIQDSVKNENVSKQVKTILSASKAINIKDTNTAELKNTNNYCYWITNNNSNNNYILTLTRAQTTDATFSYVLRNNEYFMYTNQSKNTLDILGSGTKIEFNNSVLGGTLSQDQKSIQFTCPVQEYNEIVTKGVSTFTDDMWQNIQVPTTTNLPVVIITEQEMLALGSGTTVLVESKDDENVLELTSAPTTLPLTTNYNISYFDTVATKRTELTSVSEDLDWKAYTELALNCGPEKVQTLNNTGTSSDNVYSVEEITFIDDSNGTKELSNCNILSNETLDYQGGSNVELGLTDIYGNITYPKIYAYILSESVDEDEYNAKNGVIQYTSNGSDKTFEVKLNKGNYILPIHYEFPSNEGQCSVTYDGNELDPIATGSTNYFYQIDITNDIPAQESLIISADNNTKITIYPLFKYNKLYQQNGCNYDDVLTRMQTLDTDGLYNYTYEVPEEDLVENPLSAKSFLNENHIYNKFAICQMDQNQAPQILNKVR